MTKSKAPAPAPKAPRAKHKRAPKPKAAPAPKQLRAPKPKAQKAPKPKAAPAAEATKKDEGGRPPRTPSGPGVGQLAVRLSLQERAELDGYAQRLGKVPSEVVRIALRNIGAIKATEAPPKSTLVPVPRHSIAS